MFTPRPQETVMTAIDARARLQRLAVQRTEAALAGDATVMAGLSADIEACRAAYTGLAITEIASFRAQLSGPQVG
jgi:hypothetical protein